MYNLPHASTSSVRIISPIILIPGQKPLSTTLTPQQVSELFPILRIYIERSQPSIAILPSSGIVSYIGVEQALRQREAEIYEPHEEYGSSLAELIQVYQALAFLGNKPTSRARWALGKKIKQEIDEDLCLVEYQEIWELRHMPFTQPFIKAITKRLARMEMGLANLMRQAMFQWTMDTDAEFARTVDSAATILRWVYADASLEREVATMRVELELEAKRGDSMEKRGGGSAVGRFSVRLETVLE